MNYIHNNKTYTFVLKYIVLILALFVFSATDVSAKKEKKQKKKTEVVLDMLEPDPVCHKAKPDVHHRAPEIPAIFFTRHTSGALSMEGYDISHYQGNIDWRVFASDPHAGFVYIKATEGSNIVDSKYIHNIAEARKYGVKVGSYHFFRPNYSARDQFDNFKRYFNPSQQDLLPVVDVEVLPSGVSHSRFVSCLHDFLTMIEKEYGRKPIIYTGKNFYNKHFYGTRFASYKFWIATYADEQPVLNDNDDYLIWQYSSRGRARGIKGYVDTNRFVGRHVLGEIQY